LHPLSISLATFTLLLDLAGTEFSRAITTEFCFTYTLQGVIAMPCRYMLGSAMMHF